MYFQGVTCTMGARAWSKSVEGYVNVVKRYGLGLFGPNITGIIEKSIKTFKIPNLYVINVLSVM